MDANRIGTLARNAHDGTLSFPEVVAGLVAAGVEYYRVDFAAKSLAYYDGSDAVVQVPLDFEGLPAIARDFDAAALRAAILDSQRNGQSFRRFCERVVAAGVQGYFAFLRGQRVAYFGRGGDQHVEWFPGAKPTDA